MTACQRIHALRNCLDRDVRSDAFVPWTQMVWDRLDARFWRRNRDMCIRLACQKLENLMRRCGPRRLAAKDVHSPFTHRRLVRREAWL